MVKFLVAAFAAALLALVGCLCYFLGGYGLMIGAAGVVALVLDLPGTGSQTDRQQ